MLGSFLLTAHLLQFFEAVELVVLLAFFEFVIFLACPSVELSLKRLKFKLVLFLHHSESVPSSVFFAADFIFQTVQVFRTDKAGPFYVGKCCINLLLILGFPDFLLTGENHIEFFELIFSQNLVLIQFLKGSHQCEVILCLFNLLVVLRNSQTVLELVSALQVLQFTSAQIKFRVQRLEPFELLAADPDLLNGRNAYATQTWGHCHYPLADFFFNNFGKP